MAYSKEKMRLYMREWRSNNIESEKIREENARNKPERKAYIAKYAAKYRKSGKAKEATKRYKDTEKGRKTHKKWKKENSHAISVHTATRRAGEKKATPIWVNLEAIKIIYDTAKWQGNHVDHIVPIQSKIVCGLHCEDNLQILNPFDNMSKGNRSWPNMP